MTDATLEERITALESEVMRLKHLLTPDLETPYEISATPLSDAEIVAEIERIRRDFPPTSRPKPTAPDFLDRFAGVFADDPAFPGVVRHSEEKRERERREADRDH